MKILGTELFPTCLCFCYFSPWNLKTVTHAAPVSSQLKGFPSLHPIPFLQILPFQRFKYFYVFLCACVYACHRHAVPMEARRGGGQGETLWGQSSGSCQPPEVGLGLELRSPGRATGPLTVDSQAPVLSHSLGSPSMHSAQTQLLADIGSTWLTLD